MADSAGGEETIGDRIRWVVETHLEISQSEFARRLGVKQPQMARWINDPSHPPSEASVQAIAEAASVSPAWLRYGVKEVDVGERPHGGEPAKVGRVRETSAPYGPPSGDFSVEGELERIAALDEDETVKMMSRDSLSGVLRAAWALAHERTAEKIASAIIQSDDSSRTRELIAEARRTGMIPAELFKTIPRPSSLDEIPEEPSFAELQKRGAEEG